MRKKNKGGRPKKKNKTHTVNSKGKEYTYKVYSESLKTRKQKSESAKKRHKQNPPDYSKWYGSVKKRNNSGRIWTEEQKAKISKQKKIYYQTPEGIAFKKKLSQLCKERKQWTKAPSWEIKGKGKKKNENRNIETEAKKFIDKFYFGE
jgi:hypothetical protein